MEILGLWYGHFCDLRDRLEAGPDGEADVHQAYVHALYRREGFHPYADADGTFEAAIEAIEPGGYMLLRRSDGRISRYAFKEVRFL